MAQTLRSLAICVAVGVMGVSCENPYSPLNDPFARLLGTSGGNPMLKYLSEYRTTDLVGVVFVNRVEYSTFYGPSQLIVDTTKHDVTAKIRQAGNLSRVASMANLEVNGEILSSYSIGEYHSLPWAAPALVLNYGFGSNVIKSAPGADHPQFFDTLQFSTPLKVTNVVRGMVISRSVGANLTWTGSGTDFVDVEISRQFWQETPKLVIVASSFSAPNNGNAGLSADLCSRLLNGQYDLRVTQYQPKSITLPNGKKLLVLGMSSHEITVTLVD